MPRLVSLTLLSVLALPAAALVYTICYVVLEQTNAIGYNDDLLWAAAGATAFATVIAWWSALWARHVRWTVGRAWATGGFTAASVVVGVGLGLVAQRMTGFSGFGIFVAGFAATIVWLTCACVFWRERDGAAVGAGAMEDNAATVVCPNCGYAMIGLREARCPECGEAYTLDRLFAAQPGRQDLGGV